MKKIVFLVVVLLVFAFTSYAFASELKILSVKGQVLLREDEAQPWRKAKKDDTLRKNYELMTKNRAECTFTFGGELDGAITLKGNSQLKFTDTEVRRLNLTKGRVFSIIDKLDKNSSFEISTPVAIAGVRGTGWTVEAEEETAVRCFEGEVSVQGLDQEGHVVTDTGVKEGSGVAVSKEGQIDDPFELTEKDKKEWMTFKGVIKNLLGKPLGKAMVAVGGLTEGMLDGYIGKEPGANPFNR